MSDTSLSNVVSDLVRASMGSSVPRTVTDEELDRHIGEIILREAKQKAERYKKDGIRAYLPVSDSNVPRTNKRFLSSIIRSTDDHNKAVLRSQAVAAAELKEEREEQERRERRARADEAAQDRFRRLMSGGRRNVAEDRWRPDRDGGRRREEKMRERDRDRDWTREKSRSKSPSRKRYWDEDEEEYKSRVRSSRHKRYEGDTRRERHRHDCRIHTSSRSRSPGRNKGKSKHHSLSRSRSRTRLVSSDAESSRLRRRVRSRSPARDKVQLEPSHSSTPVQMSDDESDRPWRCDPSSRSPSPRQDKVDLMAPVSITLIPSATSPARDSSPTPGPPSRDPSPPPISSKMDKYFSPTYDPRLDVAPLTSSSSSGLTIDVPATGLVDNAQFEGWDAMLELIRLRREDRAEKKRLERLGLLPDKTKEGRGKKGKGMVSAEAEDGKGIMGIEYTKKGAVREWDMGKEVI